MTYEHELLNITNDVLENYIDTNFVPAQVAEDIINECNSIINNHNDDVKDRKAHKASLPEDVTWDVLKTLKPFQVARVLLVLHKVVNIDTWIYVNTLNTKS